MKKTIFAIALMLLTLFNVKAQVQYSDYEFRGFTDEIKENDETTLYVPITYNKFYKYGETNIVYIDQDVNIDSAPYIDYNDYIHNTSYVTKRTIDYAPHYIYINSDEILSKIIRLNNFNSNNNPINEIKIYYQGKEISFSIYTYTWLNDTNIYSGDIITNQNIILKLFENYNITDLEIIIYYDNISGLAPTFTLNYIDINSGEIYNKNIELDSKTQIGSFATIRFLNPYEYESHLFETNLFDYCMENDGVCSYFIEDKYWYKHYNIDKLYFKDAPVDNLDGYTYDEVESYNMYAIFKRNIQEEVIIEEKEINREEELEPISNLDESASNIESLVDISDKEKSKNENIDNELISDETIQNDMSKELNHVNISDENIENESQNKNIETKGEKSIEEESKTIKRENTTTETNEENNKPYIAYTLNNDMDNSNEKENSTCNCKYDSKEDNNYKLKNIMLILPVIIINCFVVILHILRKLMHKKNN